ncbi:DnaJ domain-containing protein [Candidatus Calescamantes bacterium]|nr:DnaJ domain-containing protein [Candidatus Calescamantes bacterium]
MSKFEEISKAREFLGLGEEATFQEIREKYLRLIKKAHPDRKGEEAYTKELNWAYEVVKKYFDNYPISFRKEDIEKIDPDLKIKKQFWDEDWLQR